MSTINGFGTSLIGCSEVQRDGSYIATRWFCLVLPVIPLGSFRIWPESSSRRLGGMVSTSSFRAKSVGIYLPHLLKWYGMYFAFFLFLFIADRMSAG